MAGLLKKKKYILIFLFLLTCMWLQGSIHSFWPCLFAGCVCVHILCLVYILHCKNSCANFFSYNFNSLFHQSFFLLVATLLFLQTSATCTFKSTSFSPVFSYVQLFSVSAHIFPWSPLVHSLSLLLPTLMPFSLLSLLLPVSNDLTCLSPI